VRPEQTARPEARIASSGEQPLARQAGPPSAQLSVMAEVAEDAIAADDTTAEAMTYGEALPSAPSPGEQQVPTGKTSDTSKSMTIVWPVTE